MRFRHLDGARLLPGERGRKLGDGEIGERAIAYSTTFGTVKKPPPFLSAGSM